MPKEKRYIVVEYEAEVDSDGCITDDEFKWFYAFDNVIYQHYPSKIVHVYMPVIKKPE